MIPEIQLVLIAAGPTLFAAVVTRAFMPSAHSSATRREITYWMRGACVAMLLFGIMGLVTGILFAVIVL